MACVPSEKQEFKERTEELPDAVFYALPSHIYISEQQEATLNLGENFISLQCTFDMTLDGAVNAVNGCEQLGGLQIDASTGKLTWRGDNSWEGDYELKLVGVGGHNSVETILQVTILHVNEGPQLDTVAANYSVSEGAHFTLNFNDGGDDVDRDGDAITYRCWVSDGISTLKDCSEIGIMFLINTGEFVWDITHEQAGDYYFTISASDGLLRDSLGFTIYVTNENRPPVLDGIGDFTLLEGSSNSDLIDAGDGGDDLDIDGNILTYSCSCQFGEGSIQDCSTFSGISFSSTSGKFSWETNYEQAGIYHCTISASDGELTDQQTFTITVTNKDRIAEVTPNDAYLFVGSEALIELPYSDPDGDQATGCLIDDIDNLQVLKNLIVTSPCSCSVDDSGHSVCYVGLKATSGFSGETNFRYSVFTNNLESALATVTVRVKKPFLTIWKVGDPDYGDGSLTITLPLPKEDASENPYHYDFIVDWGDRTRSEIKAYDDPDVTHTYRVAGEYQVKIMGSVEAWGRADVEAENKKLISVELQEDIGLKNLSYAFYNASNLTTFKCVDNCNLAGVVDMSYMFANDLLLSTIDFSSFESNSVKSMSHMFYMNRSLESLDLSNFNTALVTDMSYMFAQVDKLTSLDLSSFNTGNTLDMSNMFANMQRLSNLNISSFTTDNVTNMQGMFSGTGQLESLDVTHFVTENVTDMSYMFANMSGLSSIDLSSFNTSKVLYMSHMLAGMSNLSTINFGSNFVVGKVVDFSYMFAFNPQLTALDLRNFDTHSAINMSGMFYQDNALASLRLNGWNIANVRSSDLIFDQVSGSFTLYCNDQDNYEDGSGTAGVGTLFGVSCN